MKIPHLDQLQHGVEGLFSEISSTERIKLGTMAQLPVKRLPVKLLPVASHHDGLTAETKEYIKLKKG